MRRRPHAKSSTFVRRWQWPKGEQRGRDTGDRGGGLRGRTRHAVVEHRLRGRRRRQCGVVHDGDLVVDLWGGHVDEARTKPWQQDTIINVWSTTKTMAALCALMLADRGELDLHAPVARYWPEFEENGKEDVEVRHLMSHSAGLSGWQQPLQPDDLYDWDKATSLLAAQAPWWEPGTASGYHAITQGYLVGEVVRRVTGATIGTFFADEVAEPLGADFHIGTRPEHDGRVAKVIPPPPLPLEGADPASIAVRTLSNPPCRAEQSWEIAWRRAEIPAAGGTAMRDRSPRSSRCSPAAAARTASASCRRPAAIRAREQIATRPTWCSACPSVSAWATASTRADTPLSPNPRTCFWGGWGGSLVVVDLDAALSVAYVMNKMGEGTPGDFRGAGIAFRGVRSSGRALDDVDIMAEHDAALTRLGIEHPVDPTRALLTAAPNRCVEHAHQVEMVTDEMVERAVRSRMPSSAAMGAYPRSRGRRRRRPRIDP